MARGDILIQTSKKKHVLEPLSRKLNFSIKLKHPHYPSEAFYTASYRIYIFKVSIYLYRSKFASPSISLV